METRVSLQKAESRVEKLEGTVVKLTDRLERERASAESTALELASLSSAVQTNTDLMLNEKSALSLQVHWCGYPTLPSDGDRIGKGNYLDIVRAD